MQLLVFTSSIDNTADHATFSINCGGKQIDYSDQMPTVFSEDLTDLGGAGFYVNTTSHWVTSHVGSDPFNKSAGIVNIDNILDSDMPELYKTARTSTSSLRYYVVGLANGRYTVKLFFAEIVITDGPGRRLFDIDIQVWYIPNEKNDLCISSKQSIRLFDQLIAESKYQEGFWHY